MKVKEEYIRINTSPVDRVGGALPELEERPAESVRLTDVPVQTTTGLQLGNLRHDGAIRVEGFVGDFVNGVRRQCGNCLFMDRDRWRDYRHKIEFSDDPNERGILNNIRAGLLETQNAALVDRHTGLDGEMDAEHAIAEMGICNAYTEAFREEIIVHPSGTCPDAGPDGQPMTFLFRPKNIEAAKRGDAEFDEVMRAAKRGTR